ncbi:N-6 DNA methylase [Acholeplasma sp. OttesenSCG-928-E16]|nr:N-6 DNA methylase [Acholeplasma sp. OttesenSCG-928-E16]
MLGAIIGDIVGSRFEWNNNKSKEFDLLTYRNFFTDDTVMTLAIAKAILESKNDYEKLGDYAIKHMREIGKLYPNCGYGINFDKWIFSDNPHPYNSYGNGAAMRVSACGFVANSLEEAIELSRKVTEITHNHHEGIKGAEATTVAIYLARTGSNIFEIRDYINNHYYPMNFKLDDIRDSYEFNETCQDTVPQAIEAFLESKNFEDAIRNAISIGGDSDTLAAITGSIAEAYYGIPTDIRKHALTYLDERLLSILVEFESKYPSLMEKGDVKIKTKKKRILTGERSEMMEETINKIEKDFDDTEIEIEETSSQKLYNHLFEACNILRGPINQDEYKSYITPILFFKRISDVYDEETEKALNESGGDKEYASFDENHSFKIPEGCHWNDVRNASTNVGTVIVNAMSGIERSNPDTLSGVFSSFDDATWTDKTKLSDDRLKDLIEHMSSIKVGNNNYTADVMGDAYEYLIKKFADLSKKNAGEFYTPRSIVKLLVNLLDPKPGDEVYDPACGTGGMLIEAIRHINNDKLTYGRIYGQEKNLATSAIARMNLFLHGAKDFKVLQGDTLRDPKFLRAGKVQKFDCTIANPPFSLDKWGSDQFATDAYGRNIWGCPTDSNADFAWLQHMVSSMKSKTGRCVVVLPQGVLFRGGKEAEMRKQLIESDILECVITLASGVFYSTGVSACILLLSNNKVSAHKGKICMINGSKFYTPKRAQVLMTQTDIDKVYKVYQNYTDEIEISKVITIAEVKANGYSLALNNYIEKKEVETATPVEIRRQYLDSYNKMIEAEEKMKQLLIEGGYINE